MISSLKPYPAYKDSGLPWLGQVPGHWSIRRLKSAATNVNAQTTEMLKDDVYIALEHVESWTGHARPQEDSQLFTGQVKRFRRGDVLFGKLRPYLAKVTRARTDGVCAGEFFVLRPIAEDLSPPYLEHALRAKNTIDVINGSTFGARMPRADWQFVGNLPIPLPPPSEQAAIVRFLDWANGRLERAIRAKRKIITLLNEQKQAIIHQAVTRGLDPSVRLKPSGIPWLGEIPDHWEVRRLRHVCQMLVSNVDKLTEPAELPVRLCNYVEVYRNERILESTRFMDATAKPDEQRRFRLRLGDVIITKDSEQWNDIGIPALVEYEADDLVCGYHLAILRPRAELIGEYLLRALQAPRVATQFHVEAKGVTRYALSQGAILGAAIPIPPRAEQVTIAGYVESATLDISTAISRLEREIEFLREYRTRLVADVVTGKIDVREAAVALPDEEPIGGNEGDVAVEDESEALDEEALT